jgi:hypothetical protein
MKKIMKISLAAVVALAGLQNVAMAGDNLADAFANGKVKGQVKSYYFAKTYDSATKDASIWVNGGMLGYKTAGYYGLSLGATGQFSSVTSVDDDSNKYFWSMNGSGAVMSELYLGYNIGNTAMKAGRHFFWTPVVGGSGSRFIRQSFEGYSLVNKDIPNTSITAAYMTKFADRTDRTGTATSTGNPGEFDGSGSRVGADGTWTVYVKNNSITNLTLQAQYAAKSETTKNSKNGHDIMYIDAKYSFGGNMKPYIMAQYLGTSYEATGQDDGKAYGLKVGANIDGFSGYLAYVSVSEDNAVVQGVGSGSIPLFTNGATVDAWSANRADTDSYKIGLGYKINSLALAAAYSSFDENNAPKGTETNFTATYKVNKNFVAQVQYSILDNQDSGPETGMDTDLRTRLIYSF